VLLPPAKLLSLSLTLTLTLILTLVATLTLSPPDGRVLLPPVELLVRAEVRVGVVKGHDKAQGHPPAWRKVPGCDAVVGAWTLVLTCVCACVCACVRACMRVCSCVCVR